MNTLTPDRLDALQEFINIGVGRAAAILNEMLETHIELSVPSVQVYQVSELRSILSQRFNALHKFSAVQLGFSGTFSGMTELVFPTDSAAALVSLLTGEEPNSPDLDALKVGTLTEIGNIVINGVMGSIGNILKQPIKYSLPQYAEDTIENLLLFSPGVTPKAVFLLAQARFAIAPLEIIGDVILIFEMISFDALLKAIDDELEISLKVN
jgi:chemotaxis protein CheC